MLLVPTKLCLSALLRLMSSLLSKRFGWLVVTALLSGVIVLPFEYGRALGLSAFVSNSIVMLQFCEFSTIFLNIMLKYGGCDFLNFSYKFLPTYERKMPQH